jgi:hypothetical protein
MEQEIINQILNHITIINDELGDTKTAIAVLQSQMETIVWWFRVIGAAFIGLMVTQIWQIMILHKNGKDKK